jgi:hypothetical protein
MVFELRANMHIVVELGALANMTRLACSRTRCAPRAAKAPHVSTEW